MNRSHLALAALLGVSAGLYAVVAPQTAPRDELNPADFFPTAVGTTWVYRTHARYGRHRDPAWQRIEVLTGVVGDGNELRATVRWQEDHRPPELTEWSVSSSALCRRWLRTSAHREPLGPNADEQRIMLLTAPVRSGETWTHAYDGDDERMPRVFTVANWQAVRVPAGVFRALRVDAISRSHKTDARWGETITTRFWFSPGVGLVRMSIEADGPVPAGTRFWPVSFTRELVSFTPGDR